jgi:hypothetical protein
MLRRFRKDDEPTPIDEQIDAVLASMTTYTPDSKEYQLLLGYLERLTNLKTKTRRQPVSPDTMALIAGNLLGILVIVAYEQKHVMTSKGFSQIINPTKR